MLYFSLGFSAIGLCCLFFFNRKSNDGLYRPVIVGLVCTIGPMCLFPAFFPGYIVSFFVGFFALAIWKRDWLPRYSTVTLIIASIVLGHLVPYLLVVRSDLRRYDELREAMAVLNPDERLKRPAKPSIESVRISEDIETTEGEIASLRNSAYRKIHFSRLHDSQVERFVNNPGFGVARMIFPMGEKEFYFPVREPIAQPSRNTTSQSRHAIEHPISMPPFSPILQHRNAVVEFAFPIGWGWERKPDEFLGFQSHQFGTHSKYESNPDANWSFEIDGGWRIASLELIGLLAHPKPTVYMTENLPRMDEAKSAPTRDPDEFETAGLKALAKGQELYFGQSRTEPLLRMVGGLRAAKSCTACHGCREGELLGAFSYTLVK